MKKFLTFLSLFLLLVFQTTAGQYIKLFDVLPNYMLVFIILYSMSNTHAKTLIFGVTCGLMMDAVSSHSLFGLSTLMIMFMTLGICWLTNRFYYENGVLAVVLVFILTFAYDFLYLFLTKGIFDEISMFYCFWRYMLPEAVLNSVICIPVRYWTLWLKNEYIRGI